MNATLQQEDSIRQSLEQTQDALERSQDRYRTYADLQHQLKMLSSQVPPPVPICVMFVSEGPDPICGRDLLSRRYLLWPISKH